MTPLQKTLAAMQTALKGKLSNPEELEGFLDAHSADAAKGTDQVYAKATQEAFEKVQSGATLADLMRSKSAV